MAAKEMHCSVSSENNKHGINETREARIYVVLASDMNYFDGLLVTAGSMARYASADAEIEWVIIDGGISNEKYCFFESKITQLHAKSCFRRIDFRKLETLHASNYHNSMMPYARMFLHSILPECDHVIYCDVDFLWRADVTELWRLRSDECSIQSTRDEFVYINGGGSEVEWFAQEGIIFDKTRYFCSGLCILNLKRLREGGLAQRFLDFLEKHPDPPLADQSIMNAVLLLEDKRELSFLPEQWQRFISTLSPEHTKGNLCLHYGGGAPWCNMKLLTDTAMCWFRECAHLYGISTWHAVRRVHGAMWAPFSRICYLIATSNPLLFKAFCFMLRILNHDGYIKFCCRVPKCSPLWQQP